jgi:iron complex transport system permease protein
MSLFLLLTLLLGLRFGVVDMNFSEIFHLLFKDSDHAMRREIVVGIRIPRVLAAAVTGGALAVCGVVMQAVVRNPMADPYLMGVSSGASLGATVCILGFGGGASALGLPISAFLGAVLTSFIILSVSSFSKGISNQLILIGLAINALCASLASLLIYLFDDAFLLRSLIFWLMGSLAPANWDNIHFPLWTSILGVIYFTINSRNLNLLMLGDDEAVSLGLNPSRFRLICLTIAALMTAAGVAFFGMIGFVGIIIPHIVRFLVGGNHIRLLPLSYLAGASFMVLVDILARNLSSSEIPLGVITGLIGSPFFIALVIKRGGSSK